MQHFLSVCNSTKIRDSTCVVLVLPKLICDQGFSRYVYWKNAILFVLSLQELRTTATRLETITSKYNVVMKTLTDYELPLFERNLAKIDHVSEEWLSIDGPSNSLGLFR